MRSGISQRHPPGPRTKASGHNSNHFLIASALKEYFSSQYKLNFTAKSATHPSSPSRPPTAQSLSRQNPTVSPALVKVARTLWDPLSNDKKNKTYNIKRLAHLLDLFQPPALPWPLVAPPLPNGYSSDLWSCAVNARREGLMENVRMKTKQYKRLFRKLPKRMRHPASQHPTPNSREASTAEVRALIRSTAVDYFLATREGGAKVSPPLQEISLGWKSRLAACELTDTDVRKHTICLSKCITVLLKEDLELRNSDSSSKKSSNRKGSSSSTSVSTTTTSSSRTTSRDAPTTASVLSRSNRPFQPPSHDIVNHDESLHSAIRRMTIIRFKLLGHTKRRKNSNLLEIFTSIATSSGSSSSSSSSSNRNTNGKCSSSEKSEVSVSSSGPSGVGESSSVNLSCEVRVPLRSHLCVATWNPGTLANNRAIDAVEYMAKHGVHAMAIQETRLPNDGASPPSLHNSYKFFGRARPKNEESRSNNCGGGVGWILHSSLRPIGVAEFGGTEEGCERHWLRIEANIGPIFLGSVYWRPGLGRRLKTKALSDEVESLSKIGRVIIAGDFNAEVVHNELFPKDKGQSSSSSTTTTTTSPYSPVFMTFVESHSLNIATDPTLKTHRLNLQSMPTSIDHILYSGDVIKTMNSVPPLEIGHAPLHVVFSTLSLSAPELPPIRFKSQQLIKSRIASRNFKEAVRGKLTMELTSRNLMMSKRHAAAAAAKKKDEGVDSGDEDNVEFLKPVSIDELAEILQKSVLSVAEEKLGVARGKRNGLPWWNDKVERALHRRREVKKKIRVNPRSVVPSFVRRLEYQKEVEMVEREWRKAVRKAKRKHWKESMLSLNTEDPDASRLFGLARALSNRRKTLLVSDESMANFWQSIWSHRPLPNEEEVGKENDEMMMMLEEKTVTAIMPTAVSGGSDDEEEEEEMTSGLCDPISREEVRDAATRLSRGKAADWHGIDNEILSNLPRPAYQMIGEILNVILRGKPGTVAYPKCWGDGRLVFLPKDTSSAKAMADPANYRPITLLSGFFKLTERVIWRRMRPWAEANGLYHPSQAGFRVGRNTVAQTFPLHVLRDWCEAKKKHLYVVFLDLAKAFDSVSHNGMLNKLLKANVPAPIAGLIRGLLDGHRNHIGEASLTVQRGAPQGSVLGPFVFSSFFDLPQELDQLAREKNLGKLPKGFPYRIPAWADDTAVIAESEAEVQLLLDACERWGQRNGMSFNAKKTVALLLGKRVPPSICSLSLCSQPLSLSSEATHLGVDLGCHSKVKLGTDAKDEAWFEEKLKSIQSLMLSRRYGLNASRSLHIVQAAIIPSILYGCEITDPSAKTQVLINRALRVIVGGYDRSKVSHLHFFTGMWRVQAIADYRRLCTVAKWHKSSEANRTAFDAFELTKKERLPFYERYMTTVAKYNLVNDWEELLYHLSSSPSLGQQNAYVKEWKEFVKARIGLKEGEWNRSELPVACKLTVASTAHPCMSSPLAHFGFMMLADAFDPPDVLERRGGKASACYLCGEEDKDRFSHLLFECEEEEVVRERKMNVVCQKFVKITTFVHLAMEAEEKKRQRKEEESGIVVISPKKLRALMTYLKNIYKIRKKARRKNKGAV